MEGRHYKQAAIIIRILFIAISVVIVAVLLLRDVVPSGKFSVSHDFKSNSPFISEIVPLQRNAVTENGVEVFDQPVYTTIDYPRPFKSLNLTVFFKAARNLFLEFGPEENILGGFKLFALNHPELNQVISNKTIWTQVSEGSTNLYQRKSAVYKYENVEQFVESNPNQARTGYYGVDWKNPYEPADLAYNYNQVNVDIPLQGTHHFYFAAPEKEVSFNIIYQDLNNLAGKDEVKLTIKDFAAENEIISQVFPDDGEDQDNAPTSLTQTAAISAELEKGVYQLSLEASDDIIISKIETNIPYFVAKQRVNLAGGPVYHSEFNNYPLEYIRLKTSAREWTATTKYRESLQDIRIGNESIKIDAPFKTASYSMPKSRTFNLNQGYQLVLDEGGVTIEGRGVFAISDTGYFSPYPWLIDHTVSVDDLYLDYILSTYQPPATDTDSLMAQSVDIKLDEVYAPNKSLRIKFASPDLNGENSFIIDSVTANLTTDPLTFSNFWQKFKRFYEREIIN